MQTQKYIKDGVILETSRRVPDSLSSDAANVKMDLKSVTVWYSAERLYDDATHGGNLAFFYPKFLSRMYVLGLGPLPSVS